MQGTSELPGFHKLSREERLKIVQKKAGLSDEETNCIANIGSLPISAAEKMIENYVGGMTLPLGIATNFFINGKDVLVPMSLEEPTVVAAASSAAKMARVNGGFHVTNTGPIMVGQIQVVNLQDPYAARADIMSHKEEILEMANVLHSPHIKATDLNVSILSSIKGPMLITELIVNTGDAMGANTINGMAEGIAPMIEHFSKGKVYVRIVSNLADKRLAKATAIFGRDVIGGREVVDGIVYAYAFADADPHRCATHNKGIMNGIVAVGLACGQDTRALEAGAHSYAARNGRYEPLSTWEKNSNGDLVGTLEMPIAVGLVGGALSIHPMANVSIKILGVKSASELANIMAAVGLAQNFAALRVLGSEGIRRGQIKLKLEH